MHSLFDTEPGQLNDAKWSSNDARAKGMLKVAIAQLGSDTINQKEFAEIVAFKTITVLMPIVLRDKKYEEEALLCESSKNLHEAKINIYSIKDKLYAAYTYAAAADAAANYAAYDAITDAVYAITTVTYSADTAVVAAAVAAAKAAAAYANATDKYLLIGANICLEALKELKSPGCQYLYLCE